MFPATLSRRRSEETQHPQTLVHRSRISRDSRRVRLHPGQFADDPNTIAQADFVCSPVVEQQARSGRIADAGVPADRGLVRRA
jgi:hypothetical protein